MFRSVRGWSEAVAASLGTIATCLTHISQALTRFLESVPSLLQTDGVELGKRVDELERKRAIWEGEVEGVLLKAQGERRTARAAEERQRQNAKGSDSEDGDVDSMEALAARYAALVHDGDAEAVEEEGVHLMPTTLAVTRASQKARATRMKFGG